GEPTSRATRASLTNREEDRERHDEYDRQVNRQGHPPTGPAPEFHANEPPENQHAGEQDATKRGPGHAREEHTSAGFWQALTNNQPRLRALSIDRWAV